MDINHLKEILSDYEYGQYNLGEQDITIQHDDIKGIAIIDNYYQHGKNPKRGTCAELTNTLYTQLQKEIPEMHITRAAGQEPTHFYQERSRHSFLLIGTQPLTGYLPRTDNPMLIYRAMESNPLLVDPSFGYVAPLEDAGYLPRLLIKQGTPEKNPNQTAFAYAKPERTLPLGFNERSELASLRLNTQSPDLFDIVVSDKKGFSKSFPLDSNDLKDIFIKQPQLIRAFHKLKHAKKTPGINYDKEIPVIQ